MHIESGGLAGLFKTPVEGSSELLLAPATIGIEELILDFKNRNQECPTNYGNANNPWMFITQMTIKGADGTATLKAIIHIRI